MDLDEEQVLETQRKVRYKFRAPPFSALNVTRQKTDGFQQFHRFACVQLSSSHHHRTPTLSVTDIHANPAWDEHETRCIVLVSSVSRLKKEWCLVQNCGYSNIADPREDYSHVWIRNLRHTINCLKPEIRLLKTKVRGL
jgi:hypothetical protein